MDRNLKHKMIMIQKKSIGVFISQFTKSVIRMILIDNKHHKVYHTISCQNHISGSHSKDARSIFLSGGGLDELQVDMAGRKNGVRGGAPENFAIHTL